MFSNINSNYVVMTTVAIVVVLALAFFVRQGGIHSARTGGTGAQTAKNVGKFAHAPETLSAMNGITDASA